MSKWFTGVAVVVAGVSLAGWASLAGHEKRIASAGNISTQKFAAVEAGRAVDPLITLRATAERGDLDAQIKLAGIYAARGNAPASQLKAFNLLQRIVDTHAEMHPRDLRASRVANAFVALGDYYHAGISGTVIKADKRRAASLYWHAASYFGDAEAQCNLAQMHLLGEGVPRNGRLAVNWLANAAKKRHARAQAILGNLLWRGADDVRRQPSKGLALLTIAAQNASGEEEARWIETLRVSALAHSQAHERAGAEQLSALWQTSIGRPAAVASTPAAGISNISLNAGTSR